MESGEEKRILFLADRNVLVTKLWLMTSALLAELWPNKPLKVIERDDGSTEDHDSHWEKETY